jgi:hypothetical protein
MDNFKKKGIEKRFSLFNASFLCLYATQKLLIHPMLMRGRAQAFCFSESATGRADSLTV